MDAVWAVEERVVWGSADVVRGIADVVKWPFERVAWAIERGLIWPLEERTGDWSRPLRTAGLAVLAVAAVGAGVLGLLWASNSGTAGEMKVAAPVAAQPAKEALAPAAPVLQGATPDFKPEVDGSASKAAGAAAVPATTAAADSSGGSASSSTSAAASAKPAPAGPAAIKVARQFASAFVLFETGQNSPKVRTTFAATATPQLAQSLLQRPPRLPANAKVPQAKVLNVVAGPQQGETSTLSVSLLRVGVTSELRVSMERDKDGSWRVTDVLG